VRRSHPVLWEAAGVACLAACLLAAGPRAIKGWGQVGDPDGDCQFEQADEKLSIRVPGRGHFTKRAIKHDNEANCQVEL
jgi:hypothetical protein